MTSLGPSRGDLPPEAPEEPARKLYILHPGKMMSKSDRQIHYIGVGQLIQLYGIKITDRYFVYEKHRTYPKDAIHLYPNYQGDYQRIHDPHRAVD